MDNSNAIKVGLIEWSDIDKITTAKISSTKFLLIHVTNPDKYVERVTGFRQKLMKGNMNIYGTPLSITPNTLQYKFDDLEQLLQSRLREFRKGHKS